MRNGLAQSVAALAMIASACATNHDKPVGGADAAVQLQVPEVLAWEPGGPYDITLNIVNNTSMILMAVMPKTDASDVTVYRLDGTVACQTPGAANKLYEKWTPRGFQPAQHWQVKRDLREYCPLLGPGVYRYEAHYRMNNAEEALRSLYTAFLGPQGGKILIKDGATAMKYEELQAVVENAHQTELAAEPSAEPGATVVPVAADAAPAPAAPQAEPPPSAADIRACVDKELLDRGLNAYGDPKDMKYPDGNPPVDEYGRILYVASRSPAIRRACKIPNL